MTDNPARDFLMSHMPDEPDDTTDTDEPAEDQADVQDDETPEADQTEDQDEASSNTDALLADLAKARRQRNEARTQLGMTQDHLEAARRQLVDHEIIRAGYKPAGIRAGGLDESALFDQSGNLDRTTTWQAIKHAARELGLQGRKTPGDDRDRMPPYKATWHDALNPK